MTAREADKTYAKLQQVVADTVKRIGFAVHGELVMQNPVATGWSRANWIVSIGTPFEGVAGTREDVSMIEQAIGQGRLLVYDLKKGDVWISNNVPYIQALNEGHSPQAPEGWVEDAIRRGVESVAGSAGAAGGVVAI